MNQVRIKPPEATCRIFTYREGLLAAFGHDLELEIRTFTVFYSPGTLRATFDPTSLHVIGAVGNGAKALFPSDVSTIEWAARNEILKAPRFSEVLVEGTVDEATKHFDGSLTLLGVKRPLRFEAAIVGDRILADVTLRPTEYGIAPYRAMFGTIKLSDRVRVVVELPLAALSLSSDPQETAGAALR